MTTKTNIKFDSPSVEETLRFAKKVGLKLKGGEVLELISDIGGGKTTFVKGLVGSAASSPSFVICNEYKLGKLKIYHFDFYRLIKPGILKREVNEALSAKKAVIILEWSDIIKDLLPEERVVIRIKVRPGDKRTFEISYPDECSYLFN